MLFVEDALIFIAETCILGIFRYPPLVSARGLECPQAPVPKVSDAICFPYFHADDIEKMLKKFSINVGLS